MALLSLPVSIASDGSSSPQQGQADAIHVERLSNGLDVVVVVRPQEELLAVNLTVAVGAADDPRGRSGIAHLIEHVSLTGTLQNGSTSPRSEQEILSKLDHAYKAWRERRSPANVDLSADVLQKDLQFWEARAVEASESGDIYSARLEPLGVLGLNATTMNDVTQYFCRMPVSVLPYWLELEADRLAHPLFRNFYSERASVQQEVRAMTGGRPTLGELLLRELAPVSGKSWSVFGSVEEIDSISRREALDYFGRTYVPSRMVLTVVGNVAPREVVELARRHLTEIRDLEGSAPPSDLATEPSGVAAPLVRTYSGSGRSVLLLAFPAPASGTEDAAALVAAAELINNEHLSPFYSKLVRTKGLATTISAVARFPGHRGPGVFLLQVLGVDGVAPAVLLEGVAAQLAAIAETPADAFEGAIRLARVNFARRLDDGGSVAALFGLHQAVHGDVGGLLAEGKALDRLSPADLVRAFETYLVYRPGESLQSEAVQEEEERQ